jgi:hypothetical protein
MALVFQDKSNMVWFFHLVFVVHIGRMNCFFLGTAFVCGIGRRGKGEGCNGLMI